MANTVIISAIRSPIGRYRGGLSALRPELLYATALNELLGKSGIDGSMVDDVITGCVTQVNEQGGNIGRLSVLLSDLPSSVPATTVNRLCGSSQQAIHFASQAIEAGDAKFVIAGGVESMSRVPMFSDINGDYEGLTELLADHHEIVHQGESAERIADKYSFSRGDLDNYSFMSHKRAASSIESGFYNNHVFPIQAPNDEGGSMEVSIDEGVRLRPDLEKMASLSPVFRPDGVITAANSSQLSDAAAALLLTSDEIASAQGLKPLAKIVARCVVGGDPTMQLLEIIPATTKALERAGLVFEDIDVFEVNEAFSSVALAWIREFEPDPKKLNPNGGAIAHGHPLGATGAILMTKLIHQLIRTDGQFGLQVMCIGHGMAIATVVERL